jgi:hypothetical protein
VLKKQLKDAIDSESSLKNFFIRHTQLIEICEDLQSIFGNYFLIFIAQCSLLVGLMSFQLAATKDFAMFLPFLGTILNQVYLLSYAGQKLHDSSLSVYDGILESNWYELKDRKMKKVIPFIIQRCQREKVIKARGFAVIKLSTFMGV